MSTITTLTQQSQDSFCVQPDFVIDRLGDYKKRDAVASKWAVLTKGIDSNGNIGRHIFYNAIKKEVVIQDSDKLYKQHGFDYYGSQEYTAMYKAISAPLLLYRCISTFFQAPLVADNYKHVWQYPLQHKESGQVLIIMEWKGGVSIHSQLKTYRQISTVFKSDIQELLTYLLSDKCAHPYDGLVAGSVA